MGYKVLIPDELNALYPELSLDEKRWIIQAFFRHLGEVTGKGGPVKFKVPSLGIFKTHGNNKNCFQKKSFSKKRVIIERKAAHKIELTKDFLLF